MKSADKMRSTGGEYSSPPLNPCLENPMDSRKRQKDMTPEDGPPQVARCPICYCGREREITNSSRKNEEVRSSRNDTQLWMCLVAKVKSDAAKNSTAQEPGMLGP